LGYDFDVVLNAAQLLRKYKDIVFVIRGVGEMASKVQKSINALRLKNVLLDTRFLPKDELVVLMESSSAFVLPMARMDFVDLGLPTKIFEYQAYGKPIICISAGEPARYVESTMSGLIVKPSDASGFAETVVRLFKDEKLGNELGMNGREYVLKHLTTQKIGERMYNLLSSIALRNN